MAKKKYKKNQDGTFTEVIPEKENTVSRAELEQQKAGLEAEIAVLQEALDDINEALE